MARKEVVHAGDDVWYGVLCGSDRWDKTKILENRYGCKVVEERTDIPPGKRPKRSIRNNNGSGFHRANKRPGQASQRNLGGLESSLLTSAVQVPNKPVVAERPKRSRENTEGRLRPRGR